MARSCSAACAILLASIGFAQSEAVEVGEFQCVTESRLNAESVAVTLAVDVTAAGDIQFRSKSRQVVLRSFGVHFPRVGALAKSQLEEVAAQLEKTAARCAAIEREKISITKILFDWHSPRFADYTSSLTGTLVAGEGGSNPRLELIFGDFHYLRGTSTIWSPDTRIDTLVLSGAECAKLSAHLRKSGSMAGKAASADQVRAAKEARILEGSAPETKPAEKTYVAPSAVKPGGVYRLRKETYAWDMPSHPRIKDSTIRKWRIGIGGTIEVVSVKDGWMYVVATLSRGGKETQKGYLKVSAMGSTVLDIVSSPPK